MAIEVSRAVMILSMRRMSFLAATRIMELALSLTRERGAGGQQNLEVVHQLAGIGIADRNDLCDHLIGFLDLFPLVAGDDLQVGGFGGVQAEDGQDAAVASDGIPVFPQDGIEQLDGFILADGLLAPHLDGAADLGFLVDDEPGGITEIIEHQAQGGAAEVQTAAIGAVFRHNGRSGCIGGTAPSAAATGWWLEAELRPALRPKTLSGRRWPGWSLPGRRVAGWWEGRQRVPRPASGGLWTGSLVIGWS